MILRRYPRYKDDRIMLWDSLRKSGYTRSYPSMLHVIRKWIKQEIEKRSPRKSKPYERAAYPGQKIQIDVKFVPSNKDFFDESDKSISISNKRGSNRQRNRVDNSFACKG